MKTFLLITFLTSISLAAPPLIKVAVIDSGFNFVHSNNISLCSTGHKNYTTSSNIDNIGHGTNVSGLIHKYAQTTNYCQIIYKVFDNKKSNSVQFTINALRSAIKENVDVINYSGSGEIPIEFERDAIVEALDKGIIVVVAAGNNSKRLTKQNCNFYPACYDDRIIVVGNLDTNGEIHRLSNYGPVVDIYDVGTNATAFGITMTGSSQATALVTGKIISRMHKTPNNLMVIDVKLK